MEIRKKKKKTEEKKENQIGQIFRSLIFWKKQKNKKSDKERRFSSFRNLITNDKFLRYLKISIFILLSLLIISIFVANVFYFKDCPNQGCFTDFMRVCSRAEYSVEKDISLQYNIEGVYFDKCSIKVTSLEGPSSGSSMLCRPKIGEVYYSEENLSVCEGDLKSFLE